MNRKKILVPLDIYANSADLLLYSGSLAYTMQARISYVAIIDDKPNYAEQENELSNQRRNVEIELSKIVNENFKHGKPEFDIIVTKGEYVTRILQMTNDLNIDLIVSKFLDFDVLKPILSQLASAFIIVHNSKLPPKQLALPVNLDASYYMKIQDSIEIAKLLNANLKLVTYTYSDTNEDKYKEKLYDIKNIVEQENVACVTSFNKWNPESESFLEDLLPELNGELPLLMFDEWLELESLDGLSEFLQSSNSVIIPTKKKYMQKVQSIKQLSYN